VCARNLVRKSKLSDALILTTQRRRANRMGSTGWQQVGRERISHQFVGGTTERIVDLSIYQPPGATPLTLAPPIQQEVPRDASTILSLKEHAKFFRPIPSPATIEPLTCRNLGTDEKPIYHGRRLLPAILSRNTWVLTPFLYSPRTNQEWGLRRLGIAETLACLDFPDD
jgi:hypothetical protein